MFPEQVVSTPDRALRSVGGEESATSPGNTSRFGGPALPRRFWHGTASVVRAAGGPRFLPATVGALRVIVRAAKPDALPPDPIRARLRHRPWRRQPAGTTHIHRAACGARSYVTGHTICRTENHSDRSRSVMLVYSQSSNWLRNRLVCQTDLHASARPADRPPPNPSRSRPAPWPPRGPAPAPRPTGCRTGRRRRHRPPSISTPA